MSQHAHKTEAESEAAAHASAVHTDEVQAEAASVHAHAAHHHPHAHASAALGGSSVLGGVRNVDMRRVNKHHRDAGQGSRIAIGGKDPVLNTGAEAYDNAGNPVGGLGAGPIKVNTGGITDLKINGKETEVVLEHGAHPGWVPIDDFKNKKELETLQRRAQTEMNKERHLGADEHKKGTVRTIVDNGMPQKDEDLFTKPDEKGQSNHAHDYFGRGTADHPLANLLENIPTWTHKGGHGVGERFGVADDIVEAAKAGATPTSEQQFHELKGGVDVPLYRHNSEKRAGHIDFDYGYVLNDDGKKRYGWINDALLGKAPKKK
jgi:hypothetical protein